MLLCFRNIDVVCFQVNNIYYNIDYVKRCSLGDEVYYNVIYDRVESENRRYQ